MKSQKENVALIGLLIIALIFGIVGILISKKQPETTFNNENRSFPQSERKNTPIDAKITPVTPNAEVIIKDGIFLPSEVKIKKGEAISLTNEDNRDYDIRRKGLVKGSTFKAGQTEIVIYNRTEKLTFEIIPLGTSTLTITVE